MSASIRIFVVEDDAKLCALLCATLAQEADIVVAGSAASAAEAIRKAPPAAPDVVIIDLGLGPDSGVDVIRELRVLLPAADFMAHTVFDDRDVVLRALKAGATSYVLKGCESDELVRAVRDVKAGGAPMTPRIARMVIRDLQTPSTPDLLSPRERQILRFIDEGLTYKEIATKLSISVHTVHGHIKSIYVALEAHGKRDALARARERGVL